MDTRRDFIFIDDLVNVVIQAVVYGTGHRHYHVSTGSDYSIKELFDATVDALGIRLDEDVEVRPRGEDDAYTILLDPSRVRADFGWDVTVPLQQGVARAIDYYRESRDLGDLHAPPGGRMTEGSLAGARILVVGGAGFVGSNLVRALLDHGPAARSSSSTTCSRASGTTCRIIPPSGSSRARSRDDETLERLPRIWASSSSSPPITATRARWSTRSPTTSTTRSRRCGSTRRSRTWPSIRRVVYASAGCTVAEKTFDGAEATTEDAPVSLWLDSPYQISKIIGEYYSNYYFTRHGLPAVKARFQNVYGPGEVLGAGRWRGTVNTVWRNAVPTFIYKALHHEALPVENGGIATRDFIYVGDMAQGLIACATRGEAGGVYNLASGVETPIRELAEFINELTGNPTPIALTPARDWDHSGQRYGATDKARTEIGFSADTDLREGLERTIAWTRDNLDWIERCIAKHSNRVQALQAA